MDDKTRVLIAQLAQSCKVIGEYQIPSATLPLSRALNTLKGYLHIAEMQIEEIQKQQTGHSSSLL